MLISRKLNEDLKVREVKPATVYQQCLVDKFQCNLCDAGYVGYTRGHLHERIDGHKQNNIVVNLYTLFEPTQLERTSLSFKTISHAY